ncbi:PEP-CTERM sorting domain-containing protein [Alteraurantiacibacter buctensis]|uniref:PEP-CTERM sorting domain-containing protein n=1 Tax=Alteraurantiacibacter buctensis TaxID=1503981 RepID=A0A844Z319_9SPHN|nr:PEP-CTERM sorting domain-containing protein [Alteraurantiacibacter buctensis]MXO73084.1 PEP-CTERM sorting domain-containing protein [Alteraurantiacibacter buctensis]
MAFRFLIVFLSSLVIFAAPVAAADSAQVPEANTITLFALGLAGVMLGRRLSRRKSDKPDKS